MHVCFVCTGNICRSPMAAIVFREHMRREGLDGRVRVTSAGTGAWHVGEGADSRARQTLAAHGYPTGHMAATVDPDHLSADLLVALDGGHQQALHRLIKRSGGDIDRVRMLRSFDPDVQGGMDVPDPYYGGSSGFTQVLRMIEAAMPGLTGWVREHLDG